MFLDAPIDCFDGYLKSTDVKKYPDFEGRFQKSGMEIIDPDGVGGTDAWPVYCEFNGFYSLNVSLSSASIFHGILITLAVWGFCTTLQKVGKFSTTKNWETINF